MRRFFIFGTVLFFSFLAVAAHADQVYSVTGNILEGKIVREDAREVELQMAGGTLLLYRSEIKKIVRKGQPAFKNKADPVKDALAAFIQEEDKTGAQSVRRRHEALAVLKSHIEDVRANESIRVSAMRVFLAALSDPDSDNSAIAEDCLRKMKLAAAGDLLRILKKPEEPVSKREKAASILCDMASEGNLRTVILYDLKNILKINPPPIQAKMLKVVDDLHSPYALPVLPDLLKTFPYDGADESARIRWSTFKLIENNGDEKTVQMALPVLNHIVKDRSGPGIKQFALRLFLKAEQSSPAVFDLWMSTKVPEVKNMASELLVLYPETRFVDQLARNLDVADDAARKEAFMLLFRIHDVVVIDALMKALPDQGDAPGPLLFVLKKLTGRDFKADAAQWKRWWDKERDIVELRWFKPDEAESFYTDFERDAGSLAGNSEKPQIEMPSKADEAGSAEPEEPEAMETLPTITVRVEPEPRESPESSTEALPVEEESVSASQSEPVSGTAETSAETEPVSTETSSSVSTESTGQGISDVAASAEALRKKTEELRNRIRRIRESEGRAG